MIVLRNNHKVYYPRLDIRACLAIDKLFGSVTQPLMSHMSVETQVLLLSLSLQQYHLSDDELYDLMDTIDDINSLILELYGEGGLISQEQDKNAVKSDSEPTSSASNEEEKAITFESHMMELLEQAMSIGMTERDFYNSTLNQVTRYVKAYNSQQQNELEQKAFMDYQLANLIGLSVSRLLSKNAKYPKFEDAYPFIHLSNGNQDVGDDGMTPEERQAELNRIKLIEWAEQMNKKFNVERSD